MLAIRDIRDWFILGLYLRVDYAELKGIETNYHDNLKRCQLEMLRTWICSGNARWDILVKVLQDNLHIYDVAMEIKQMLAEKRNLMYVNKTRAATNSSFWYPDIRLV